MNKIRIISQVVLALFIGVQCAYADDEAAKQLQRLQEIQRLQQQGQPDAARALATGVTSGAPSAQPPGGQSNAFNSANSPAPGNPGNPLAGGTESEPKVDPELIKRLQAEAQRKSAYDSMVEDQFPLSPSQIIQFRKQLDAQERAAATGPTTPPKPVASSQIVALAPGSTPPILRLSQGFVSSLVFIDSTGQPWPIDSYDIGNPTAFNIQWDKQSNTMMVQSMTRYTYGNMAIKLVGLNTPIMMTLVPAQQLVDYRVDMRVQGLGPNAAPLIGGDLLPSHVNSELLSVLDGVAPAGATVKKVAGGDAQVWVRNGRMFVRTTSAILSPSWIGTLSSADGMHVYELLTTPLLLVSDNGRVKQLKIEGL